MAKNIAVEKKGGLANGCFYLLPPLFSGLLPLLTLPFFSRALTPDDFGAYALAQVYALFVSGLVNMGLPTAYERNYHEAPMNVRFQGQLLYGVLLWVLGLFGLTAALTWFMRGVIADFVMGDGTQGGLLFWCTCAAFAVSFKHYFLLYFRNTENAAGFAYFSVAELVGNVAWSMLFVLGLGTGVVGLAWGQFIASATVLVVLVLQFVHRVPFELSWTPLRDSVRLALPLTPMLLFRVVGNQADKYLLGLLGSIGGVGLYSIGQRFGGVVFTWMNALQNLFSPQIYRRMFTMAPDEGGKSIGRYLTPFAWLSVGGALGIVLFVREVLMALTPPSFHDAYPAAIVLALYNAVLFFGKIPQLAYARRTHISAALSIAGTLLTLGCCAAGIRMWGTMGAAWGVLGAGVLICVAGFVAGQKAYYIRWEYGRLVAIYGYLFVAAGLMLYFYGREPDLLLFFVAKVVLGLGYLGLGAGTGAFGTDVWTALSKKVRPGGQTL